MNLKINKKTKILKFEKHREFTINELNNRQSLKAIAGRSKLAYLNGEIEQPISVMTLYSYIDNENILFINHSHLKRKRKHKYRTRNYVKDKMVFQFLKNQNALIKTKNLVIEKWI